MPFPFSLYICLPWILAPGVGEIHTPEQIFSELKPAAGSVRAAGAWWACLSQWCIKYKARGPGLARCFSRGIPRECRNMQVVNPRRARSLFGKVFPERPPSLPTVRLKWEEKRSQRRKKQVLLAKAYLKV